MTSKFAHHEERVRRSSEPARIDAKPTLSSCVEMTELVLPQHTNAMGTVFGGVVLSWIDIAAATSAQRFSGRSVVTASFDAMHFLAPIKLGWIVTIRAMVNYVHKSSCEVGVRVEAENPLTREYNHTASAYVTMVALDSNGKPVAMPELLLQDEVDQQRHDEAIERRKARLALKALIDKRRNKEKNPET